MGRVVHFEIHAGDPQRAIAFYTGAFGWLIEQWGTNDYWPVTTGSNAPGIDGAIVPRRGDPGPIGAPVNGYVCTISVDDLDRSLGKVVNHGGRVAVERSAVPGVGWIAYFADTEGNLVGLMQDDPAAA